MDPVTFTTLRDIPDKRIEEDIKFQAKEYHAPSLYAKGIKILGAGDADLRMQITYNPEQDSININVTSVPTGAICRLDVRHTNHKEAGRTHKHIVVAEGDAPVLPYAEARPDLDALTVKEAFDQFCEMANISHTGEFGDPMVEGGDQ